MAESTLTFLDSYCERAGDAAMLAEPINAITNLFFILAAMLAARAIFRLPPATIQSRLDLWLLAAMLFAIGLGSGLWHLRPNGSTLLMDVIPITLFIHIYLIAAMRRLLQFSWVRVIFWWGVYMAASVLAQIALPPDLLNGTIMYIPTYLTLIALTVAVQKRDAASGTMLLRMLAVWTLSLTFRTLDSTLCAALPIGTHFLWHTLNAYMLYHLLMLLVSKR